MIQADIERVTLIFHGILIACSEGVVHIASAKHDGSGSLEYLTASTIITSIITTITTVSLHLSSPSY